MSWNVIVDADKCTGDGECVDICPVEVYELQEGKAVVVAGEDCLGCESCVEVCESGAITIEEMQFFISLTDAIKPTFVFKGGLSTTQGF